MPFTNNIVPIPGGGSGGSSESIRAATIGEAISTRATVGPVATSTNSEIIAINFDVAPGAVNQ